MQSYPYTLIRAKRKSVSLRITPELELVVRCPIRMSVKAVDAFVNSHSDWIEKHMAELSQRAARRTAFTFADSQEIWYLGKSYLIETCKAGELFRFDLVEKKVYLENDEASRPKQLEILYRQKAKDILQDRLDCWSRQTGLTPKDWKITGAKKRWGSCSSRGNICFSLRLVCLPEHLIDYVVVHELSHLVHHNHSPQFYGLVERYLPDYRTRQQELRAFQEKLNY